MKKARRKLEKDADRFIPIMMEEVLAYPDPTGCILIFNSKNWIFTLFQIRDFVTEHAFLAGGFAGGFLLGLAT